MTGLPEKIDVTLTALLDIRGFFANPDNWLQGSAADDAGRYCLVGYSKNNWHGYVLELLDKVAAARMPKYQPEDGDLRHAAWFNDTHTHAELLELIDEAIALHTAQSAIAC